MKNMQVSFNNYSANKMSAHSFTDKYSQGKRIKPMLQIHTSSDW